MSTRALYRFVPHTIRHEPEGGVTFEAFCVTPDCGEDSGPRKNRPRLRTGAYVIPAGQGMTCSAVSRPTMHA